MKLRRPSTKGRSPTLAASFVLTVAVVLGGLAACGEDGSDSGDEPRRSLPRGDEPVDLDPADFTADIDHPYLPMEPGTRWTYREVDEEGNVVEVVVVVTTETKTVANGITARVVRDTVREDGEIVEDTRDWFAQDEDGNVWYLGEDTAEFEDGALVSHEGAWEAGVDGALPGIILPADPRPGMAYRQEYLAGEAEDNGRILAVGEDVEVRAGSFDDVLRTEDTNALEPDVVEHKYYARGVGLVLTVDVQGGSGREELIRVDDAPPSAGIGPLGRPNS